MKVNKILLGTILSVIFIVYNLIVFICFHSWTSTSWCAYIFTILAFVLVTINMIVSNISLIAKKVEVCNLTIKIISIVYLVIQLTIGIIFRVLPDLPLKITAIIEIIVVAIYIIIYIFLLIGKNVMQNIDSNTHDKVLFIKLLSDDVMTMIDSTTDVAIKSELEELKFIIDASDPMSDNSLINIEKRISGKVSTLLDLINANNKEKIKILIIDVKQMLLERNRKCKMLK